MKFYTVYKTVNKINKKYYIGKHITDNPYDCYIGSGKWLKRAIKKYGIENFEKSVLYIFNNRKDMENKEKELVNEKDNLSYNLKKGGDGGFDYINENKKNIYKNHKKVSQENIKIAKKALETLIKTDINFYNKWKNSISIGQKKTYDNGRKNGFLGKKHKKETKEKISYSQKKIDRSGEKNPNYGKCWIHSIEKQKNILIEKNNLQYWLNLGWIKGSNIKYYKK